MGQCNKSLLGLGIALAMRVSTAQASTPPKLRLGNDVRPAAQSLDLTIVPGRAAFTGTSTIDVEVQEPTRTIWLNANAITVAKAEVTSGGSSQPATVVPGGTDFLGLEFARAVPRGRSTLRLEYSGKISDSDSAGVFQGKDGDDLYVFTQFEAILARRAFPCFDEPGFKNPWRLTVHVKKEHMALANTNAISETDEPGGMKKVVFAPTPPLPSYLVAFAVGPFEIVDGGLAGLKKTPIRIVTPRGKTREARYAAEVTGPILERLEDYFGRPYPFDKLDSLAIPLTFGFGAMENVGLITYAQTILLADPAVDTEERRREYVSVAAHEIAHQWFGDLVTPEWWDDIWLNEAFATWMSSKLVAAWKPEWQTRLEDLGSKFYAMEQDALVSARKVRQPIETNDDIANAFDAITYEKGAAVIRMFESWMGEGAFRQGVRSYLDQHAFGSARLGDFLAAVGGPEPRLAAAFSTFLDQPGFPEVSVTLRCEGEPTVTLRQERHLPLGSSGAPGQIWRVPVCVSYATASGPQGECLLLDAPEAAFKLSRATSCPALLVANRSATGYYVGRYEGTLLPQLLEDRTAFLSAEERRSLLNDLVRVSRGGHLAAGKVLSAIPYFAHAPERPVVEQAQKVAADSRRLLPIALAPNYRRFVDRAFGERARQLGWTARPEDDAETRLMRAQLVPFVARQGEDGALRTEARRLAEGWLAERTGVEADLLRGVLSTAAAFADKPFFDRLVAELRKTRDRQQREELVRALGSFRDPASVTAAFDLLVHSDLDFLEIWRVLFGPLQDPSTDSLPFAFVKANGDEILKRAPSGGDFEFGAILPFVGRNLCDRAAEEEFVAYFRDRAPKFTGGPRNYQQALEAIHLCIAQKAAQGAEVTSFFAAQ